MKQKIVNLLISVVIVLAVAKIVVSVAAYHMATSIQDSFLESAAIDFESFGTNLISGTVEYSGVRFRPFAFKREVRIDGLELIYGGPFGLLSSMVSSAMGNHYGFNEIQIRDARIDVPDSQFYDWLAETSGVASSIWVGWISCSGDELLSSAQLRKMGVPNVVFDARLTSSGARNWSVVIEPEELGRIEAQARLKPKTKGKDTDELFDWLELQRLTMVENGLFRRQLNACNKQDEKSLEAFSVDIVQSWTDHMRELGYRLDDATTQIIEQYMQSGGVLTIDISKSEKIGPRGSMYGWQRVPLASQFLLTSNQDLSHQVVIERFIPEPPPEPKPEVIVEHVPAYAETPKENLENYIRTKVRVKMKGNKVHEGWLTSVDEFRFEIEPLDGAGKVAFSLERKKIIGLEVWK